MERFFWDLSADRKAELVGTTFDALTDGVLPSNSLYTGRNYPTSKLKTKRAMQQPEQDDASDWGSNKPYSVGEQVTYEGKTYRCRHGHTSSLNRIPSAVPVLWSKV